MSATEGGTLESNPNGGAVPLRVPALYTQNGGLAMIEAAEMQVVQVGPGILDRLNPGRVLVAQALLRLRLELEEGAAPGNWAAAEMPAGLLLSDVCNALGLNGRQRREVLGEVGAAYLTATGA